MAALKKGRLGAPLMASAGQSFKACIAKLERAHGESGGNALGAAAAGACERRKKRGRRKHRKGRCKKKQQKLEECLTLEVGLLKVCWKEKYWKV